MRRRYLITYDVADDRRRTKLFNLLRDAGDHAQYSVFFGELTAAELAGLRGAMSAAVHHGEDQVLVVDLGPSDPHARHPFAEGVEAIGRPYASGGERVLVV